VIALAVVAALALILTNPAPVVEGSYVTVEPEEWPLEDGKALGPEDAAVVVQEFSDFQCPYCRQFESSVMDRIVADYIPSGQVRFEYKHYIVIDANVGGNESRRAAEASECAAEQGRFWDFNNMVFANQQGEGTGAYSDARLRKFAEELSLDTEAFNSCFNSRQYADQVNVDQNLGRQLGVTGTPTLFVNGVRVANPLDYEQVRAAIDEALSSSS
jgi:protein-disulfide isomerase